MTEEGEDTERGQEDEEPVDPETTQPTNNKHCEILCSALFSLDCSKVIYSFDH